MALFSRPVLYQSVTEDTLYYLVAGSKYYTVPTFYSHDLRVVLMTPIPSYLGGNALRLVATSDILDFRGNPVKARDLYVGNSGTAPASNAITPSAGTVSPTSGTIKGNHRFRITWPTNNDNNLHSMNAGSINDGTIDLVQIIGTGTGGSITTGSKIFSATGTPFSSVEKGYYIEVSGASDSADNGRWKITSVIDSGNLETEHVFNANNTNLSWTVIKKYKTISDYYPNAPDSGDIAEFQPVEAGRDAAFMPAGANIRLIVYFRSIANLYNIGANSNVTYTYTVESTPPVISTSGIKAVSETLGLVEAAGVTDIKADSRITLIFNEDIDSKIGKLRFN
jgi:hypothetical protein